MQRAAPWFLPPDQSLKHLFITWSSLPERRNESTRVPCRHCLPCVTLLMTDGCVHLLYNSCRKFHQLAAGQLLSGQPVRYGKARRYGQSITFKITPAESHSSRQPGGPPCWTSPLAFGLLGHSCKLNTCSSHVTLYSAVHLKFIVLITCS